MKILFVCTGNTCRSPMAAAMMNKLASENDLNVKADSAGLYAGNYASASKEAIDVMRDAGIDLTMHRTKRVSKELISENDIILTMTEAHKIILEQLAKGKVFTIAEYAGGTDGISDPFGGDYDDYKETATEIYDYLTDIAEIIAKQEND